MTHARPILRLGAATLTLGVGLGLGLATPAVADQTYWAPADESYEVTGHGYGHGRGMSQYGARGAAREGVAWKRILGFYYPDTSLDQLSGGSWMRVLLTGNSNDKVIVSDTKGLAVKDLGNGKVSSLSRSGVARWRLGLTRGGHVGVWYRDVGSTAWRRHLVLQGNGEFRAPGPLTLWRNGHDRTAYRGHLRGVRQDGGLRAVNAVPLESYVRGVVPAEMPSSWERAAVRAQSVAARTYAVRHRNTHPRRWYHVDDTISYQVYAGMEAERDAANDAVAATAGHIVRYRGAPALTEFSSSSGGLTADSSLPYQRVMPDPYDAPSGNPYGTWRTSISAGRLESAHDLGDLQRIVVTDRSGCGGQPCAGGGRIDRAQLVGTKRTVAVSGNTLRTMFGLRSTWFTPEPTPIIQRWRSMGGDSSVLGAPRRAEQRAGNGEVQVFENGRMFHRAPSGAHEVHGAILATYMRIGGGASKVGFPVTDEVDGKVDGLRLNRFQRGNIYHHPRIGQHVVRGAIHHKYRSIGAETSPLGLPTSDETAGKVDGLRLNRFQRGTIYHHPRIGQHVVRGAINLKYRRIGAETSPLGLPTSDETAGKVDGLRLNRFERGNIYHHPRIGQHVVRGAIHHKYRSIGAESSDLGLPVSDEYETSDGARTDFENGWISHDRGTRDTSVHYE